MTDAGEVVFLPRLMPWLREHAPGSRLDILQLPVVDYFDALEHDQVDLAIGNLRPKSDSLYVRRLFSEYYILISRPDHELAVKAERDGGISLEAFLSADQVIVHPPNSFDVIADRMSAMHGQPLRIALEVPHFMMLAAILERTNLIALVPGLVARELARKYAIVQFDAPFESQNTEIRIGWHSRQQNDPGNRWLRTAISKLMKNSPDH
jgi:DNA-binding transcriptional LysR family regulator